MKENKLKVTNGKRNNRKKTKNMILSKKIIKRKKIITHGIKK